MATNQKVQGTQISSAERESPGFYQEATSVDMIGTLQLRIQTDSALADVLVACERFCMFKDRDLNRREHGFVEVFSGNPSAWTIQGAPSFFASVEVKIVGVPVVAIPGV